MMNSARIKTGNRILSSFNLEIKKINKYFMWLYQVCVYCYLDIFAHSDNIVITRINIWIQFLFGCEKHGITFPEFKYLSRQ